MNFKIISCLSVTLLFFISCKKELKTNQVSKDGMVFIKGGTFLMGAGVMSPERMNSPHTLLK